MAREKKPVTQVRVEKLSVAKGHRVPNATVPSASRSTSGTVFRRGSATTDTSWRRK
jgi:hypothetical protein